MSSVENVHEYCTVGREEVGPIDILCLWTDSFRGASLESVAFATGNAINAFCALHSVANNASVKKRKSSPTSLNNEESNLLKNAGVGTSVKRGSNLRKYVVKLFISYSIFYTASILRLSL